jgi:integrase
MPRRKEPPHLWLRPARRRNSKLVARSTWLILDGGRHVATGCSPAEITEAERKLSAYIANKHQPNRREQDIEQIMIADVLAIYDSDGRQRQANKEKFDERLARLNDFWGAMPLSRVNGELCRAYVKDRGSDGGARRDLEDLRAAINHHAREGLHRGIVRVWLPPRGLPRDRWLTREEAAKLLWTCWRYRESQKRHRGSAKGKRLTTAKRPLRHLARFILLGLYSGSRAGTIAAASPIQHEGRSFVDLKAGVFYRLPQGRRATNKRQPPVPIPSRLLAHLRRWQRVGNAKEHFVEFAGKPVKSVKTAFKSAVKLAGLPGRVTPHTLRHTAATWLMQHGAPLWEAAGYLGMSEKTLREVYGHHHPDHLQGALRALNNGKPQSLVISLAQERERRAIRSPAVEDVGGPGRTRTSNQTVMSGRL